MSKTRIYKIWSGIKRRCFNENNDAYYLYGARGITMCEEWKNDFMSFYNWAMKNGYKNNLTIERDDVNGNYEPDNCLWETPKNQANNRRTNVFIEIDGVKKTIAQWSEIAGVTHPTITHRYSLGIRGKDLLKPANVHLEDLKIEIEGEYRSLSEWSRISGIHRSTLEKRLKKGFRTKEKLFYEADGRERIEFDGGLTTFLELSEKYNIDVRTIRARYRSGIRDTKLIERVQGIRKVEIDGELKTLTEISRETGISKNTLSARYRKGLRGKDIIAPVDETMRDKAKGTKNKNDDNEQLRLPL